MVLYFPINGVTMKYHVFFFPLLISAHITQIFADATAGHSSIINNTDQSLCLDVVIPEYSRADIKFTKLGSQDALYKAILDNSVSQIRAAIQAGANVNLPKNGKSPLFTAVLMKNGVIIEELLKHGARDTSPNKLIETAIKLKDMHSALLIARTYGILNSKYFGQTLLHHALIAMDIGTALILIKNGADFSGKISSSNIQWWCNTHNSILDVMELLIAQTGNCTNHDKALEATQELINRGYRVDEAWSFGFGSNSHGLCSGYTEALKIFLNNGANPNYLITNFKDECAYPTPRSTWTPLIRAVYLGDIKTVNVLLAHGADINQKASPNVKYADMAIMGPQTALSMAIARGWSEIVKVLVAQGASL